MGVVTKIKRYGGCSSGLLCGLVLFIAGYSVWNFHSLMSQGPSGDERERLHQAQSVNRPGSNGAVGDQGPDGHNQVVKVNVLEAEEDSDKGFKEEGMDNAQEETNSRHGARENRKKARGNRKKARENRHAGDGARRIEGEVEHGSQKVRDNGNDQPPPSVFELVQDVPVHTKLPKAVYYLWCSKNPTFVFANYLSLLSVAKFLRPEKILFLYNKYPEVDIHSYNTWLDEFREQYAYIELKELSADMGTTACSDFQSMMGFVYDYIKEGGIFIGTNTILTQPAMHLWDEDYISCVSDCRSGIIVNAPGAWRRTGEFSKQQIGISCPYITKNNLQKSILSLCSVVYLEARLKDIWHLESENGRLLNFLMYGVERTPEIRPHSSLVVPNVAHMLWLNGKAINYLFYLSALSLIYVVRVDTLYIHGTIEPEHTGYWAELMKESKVQYIQCEKPDTLFGQHTHSMHHMSDLFRAQLMDRYGGIYSDVDVIWTQPLSDELRQYDAGAALDWAHNYMYYPDYINLGVSFGRKGAPFWKLFLQTFKVIKDDVFGYNGLLQPYKVYERHPDTIKIQRNLQVMCFREDCYPSWTKDWKSVNWKNDTYAFHWTFPDPKEFHSRKTLMASNSEWGKIGKYVLEKSGK